MASTAPAYSLPLSTIAENEWRVSRRQHEELVRPWAEAETDRASRGEKHPVYDFLFDYYSFRPSHLLRWHPGLGCALAGASASEYLQHREYRPFPEGVAADPGQLPPNRRASVEWILTLLENCRDRPPSFGCFGLHEWAMVYRADQVRHARYPLRLSADGIAEVVESMPVRCTHYDAFRFFTPAARPLNKLQPSKQLQHDLEQRGCLHVTMDLYKWAFKLSPFTPSDLVAKTFVLATRVREVDMRASPYDFRALGFEPIPVETRDGRAEYERLQRSFAAEGEPLRDELVSLCRRLLASLQTANA